MNTDPNVALQLHEVALAIGNFEYFFIGVFMYYVAVSVMSAFVGKRHESERT